MSDNKATPEDVHSAYRLLLGREPDPGGYSHYCALLAEQTLSAVELALRFIGSAEFQNAHGVLSKADLGERPREGVVTLRSQACTQRQIESSAFRYWATSLHEKPGGLHRKLWEWSFICQALFERGMLVDGQRGLGFAVGTEPLSALFAKSGCRIVASDLNPDSAGKAGWIQSNQHASSLLQLNGRGICPEDVFVERVQFVEADMCAIPADLRGFDFLWSSCAMEHLGSLQNGMDFVINAMECLRPGGVAVHTTELNCDSNRRTIETGGDVIYRQRDLLELAALLQAKGHSVEPFDFDLGETAADRYIDEPPYKGASHLKLRIGGYASTSFGLIITKSALTT
jgi:hypothetical protein